MGRKLRTPLPMMPAKVDQKVPKEALEEAEEREANYREKQAKTFDEKHRSILLPQLCKGDNVWVRDQERDGIVEKTSSPRSYLVETEKGIIRQNRSALVSTHSPAKSIEEPRLPSPPRSIRSTEPPVSSPPLNILGRSKRTIKPPQRLVEE